MSNENEVVSQTPAGVNISETNVDEMKTNAKKVMEQAVAASQKRSLDNASEDSNSLVDNSADDDSNLAKNGGSRVKKLRVANDDNGEESLDQVEDDNVEDEENDEEDIEDEEDVDDDYVDGEENGSVPDGEQDLGEEDDTNGGCDDEAGDDE